MAHLDVSIDGRAPIRRDLEGETLQIGRHPQCDVVVEAGAVSRYHARVHKTDAGWDVEDAGSRNGTFVNGQLIDGRQALTHGDQIRISDVTLVYHSDDGPHFTDVGADVGSGFASGLQFGGTRFDIEIVDEERTERLTGSKVEFRRGEQGVSVTATAEAKLAALVAINRNLTGAISLDEVLPKVLDSLFEIFPAADRGFVVMKAGEGRAGGTALIPRWVKTRRGGDDGETVRISRTIINAAMDSGETILSFDAMDDSRFDSSESIADFSIRSMICSPLFDQNREPLGCLQIDSTQGRGQFREDDVDLLAGIAAQAGVLINNAAMVDAAMRQKEVEQDLKLATDVQIAFLPSGSAEVPTYEIESHYQAANHIGGDYYDYIPLSGGRTAIVLADVVGHGVAAAMYMAKLASETRFCLASYESLSTAIEELNDRMSRLHVERFVTFILVVVNPAEDEIAIVNAGHMPPIVRRSDGTIEEPGAEDSGLPIAIEEGMEYQTVTTPFHLGDLAILYTDGINEAMDPSGREWGIDPLRQLINDPPPGEGSIAASIKNAIIDGVTRHIGTAAQFDDMCAVVFRRSGESIGETNDSTAETHPALVATGDA